MESIILKTQRTNQLMLRSEIAQQIHIYPERLGCQQMVEHIHLGHEDTGLLDRKNWTYSVVRHTYICLLHELCSGEVSPPNSETHGSTMAKKCAHDASLAFVLMNQKFQLYTSEFLAYKKVKLGNQSLNTAININESSWLKALYNPHHIDDGASEKNLNK